MTEFPTENGLADYALFVNGQLIGIIEAQKVGVSPPNVLEQAKRYSKGVRPGSGDWDGYAHLASQDKHRAINALEAGIPTLGECDFVSP